MEMTYERERRWNLSSRKSSTAKAKKRKLNLLTRQQRHALRVLEDARHEQGKNKQAMQTRDSGTGKRPQLVKKNGRIGSRS
jgi:hypothetical protein